MIVELQSWRKTKRQQQLAEHCREFEDYYEYCFIDDYTDKFGTFQVHSIQVGDAFIGILQEKGQYVLVSAQFLKKRFTLSAVAAWIDRMGVFFQDAECTRVRIAGASHRVDAVAFQGRPLVVYERGQQTIDVDLTFCPEVCDTYRSYDCIVSDARAKAVQADLCRVPIFLNGERVDSVPEIHFDRVRGDLVICNGMVIVADLIEDYCGTVGFTNTEDPLLPAAFFYDDQTPIYIDVATKEDGSRVCTVRQNSMSYDEAKDG
ncbi:MAG: hypothetical protein K6T78_10420 [Alicyclobacillus sp.]|nr:hypothetical protein [Alicyclobacillus sp.]